MRWNEAQQAHAQLPGFNRAWREARTRTVQGRQRRDFVGHVGRLAEAPQQLLGHGGVAQAGQVALRVVAGGGAWRSMDQTLAGRRWRGGQLWISTPSSAPPPPSTPYTRTHPPPAPTSALFFSARLAQAAALNS